MLGAAKQLWEYQGCELQGVALSGIAAVNLQREAHIPSRTIASFRFAVKAGHITLTKKSVVIMDEAGMTDSESMEFVLNAVRRTRAKLVLVGDTQQLQPVGPGASFRAILEKTGFSEISNIYRQRDAWQREATMNLSLGRTYQAIEAYERHGCVHFSDQPFQAKLDTVIAWLNLKSQQDTKLSDIIILAHRNVDAREINALIRQERLRLGEITEGKTFNNATGEITLSEHDRILLTKNNRELGVKNGQLGTIEKIFFNRITLRLDGDSDKTNAKNGKEQREKRERREKKENKKKVITINAGDYKHFTHGYAATIHKTQGCTVKHSLVYVAGSKHWNRHLAYVALSRHKESCHIYTDKFSYQNSQSLARQLSTEGLKESVLDYPTHLAQFAERRGINPEGLFKKITDKLHQELKALKLRLAEVFEVNDDNKEENQGTQQEHNKQENQQSEYWAINEGKSRKSGRSR